MSYKSDIKVIFVLLLCGELCCFCACSVFLCVFCSFLAVILIRQDLLSLLTSFILCILCKYEGKHRTLFGFVFF